MNYDAIYIQVPSQEELEMLYPLISPKYHYLLNRYNCKIHVDNYYALPCYFRMNQCSHQGIDKVTGEWPEGNYENTYNNAIPPRALVNPAQYPEYFI